MYNDILMKIKEYALAEYNALCYLDQEMSYDTLDKTTDYMAHVIREKIGGKTRRPILIYQERGIKFIQYMIAVWKCGCYYIPEEDSVPLERVLAIYKQSNSVLVLSNKNLGTNSNCIKCDLNGNRILNERFELPEVKFDDLVYVMYTSGTTGKPKGVKIQYSNLYNLVRSFEEIIYNQFDKKVNVGVIAPFSFDASVKQIFCSLFYGHKLCIAQSNVRNFGRLIHKFHNTNELSICDLTPSHLKIMMLQKTDYKSKIPYLIVGGENLEWKLLYKYCAYVGYTPCFINVYGPTECCVDVSYNIINDNISKKNIGYVPIGIPVLNTEIFLVDANGQIVKTRNMKAELVVKGEQVGAGYTSDSNECFDDIGGTKIFKTGDIAYYNDEDEIIIVGRKDKQVKMNGYRVELDEVANVIEKYLMSKVVVIMITENDRQYLVACIEGNEKSKKETIIYYLKEKLPIYMIPNDYFYLDCFPINENGKVDEVKIRKLYLFRDRGMR